MAEELAMYGPTTTEASPDALGREANSAEAHDQQALRRRPHDHQY